MFTGIVQARCRVVAITDDDGIRSLTVDLGPLAHGLELGASVANNGACLTASMIDAGNVTFDVIGETLDLTNLSNVAVGDTVNIERSLKFGDELGGHMLSGHVSGQATVEEIVADGGNRTMWFTVDAAHMPFLLWKGWVAVDGISLTISRVDRERNRFAVSLIPETLQRTTLGTIQVGGSVNIELDAQTQTIVATVQDVVQDVVRDMLRDMLRDPDLRRQILGSA